MTDAVADTPLRLTIHPQQPERMAVNRFVPESPNFWGEGGLSFKSFLDIINPLQHIPVVSTIYQALTGDTPSSGSNLAGGAIFGGPIGFVTALADEIIKSQTGHTLGGNLFAMATGDSDFQVAQNDIPFLSASQRSGYNAYVNAKALA